jgi:hypothetical protein
MNPYRNDTTARKPLTVKPCSTARSNEGDDAFFSNFRRCQRSRSASADECGNSRHLIYLSRHRRVPRRHRYLDWAAKAIDELEHHPKLQEWHLLHHQTGWMGLELSISRSIIEAHEGKLWDIWNRTG